MRVSHVERPDKTPMLMLMVKFMSQQISTRIDAVVSDLVFFLTHKSCLFKSAVIVVLRLLFVDA